MVFKERNGSPRRPPTTGNTMQSPAPCMTMSREKSGCDLQRLAAALGLPMDGHNTSRLFDTQAFARSDPSANLTFTSQWGDGLTKGSAYTMWKHSLQTTYTHDNETVWGGDVRWPSRQGVFTLQPCGMHGHAMPQRQFGLADRGPSTIAGLAADVRCKGRAVLRVGEAAAALLLRHHRQGEPRPQRIERAVVCAARLASASLQGSDRWCSGAAGRAREDRRMARPGSAQRPPRVSRRCAPPQTRLSDLRTTVSPCHPTVGATAHLLPRRPQCSAPSGARPTRRGSSRCRTCSSARPRSAPSCLGSPSSGPPPSGKTTACASHPPSRSCALAVALGGSTCSVRSRRIPR